MQNKNKCLFFPFNEENVFKNFKVWIYLSKQNFNWEVASGVNLLNLSQTKWRKSAYIV